MKTYALFLILLGWMTACNNNSSSAPEDSDDGSDTDADAGADGDAGSDTKSDRDSAALPDADCAELISNPSVNWRESALRTDQEIVECLATSLGTPVGFGEKARGGYDPNGGSNLVVITKDDSVSVEQQIASAVAGEEHKWIVFDKDDFADPHEIGMYRLNCNQLSVQTALGGATEDQCINYESWCSENGISDTDECLNTFFNVNLNDGDLPIRNVRIGSNTTLDGRQSEAYFLFSGFAIGADSDGSPTQTASSVILTNLYFRGVGHDEDHDLDPDMIRSTGASHDIWIHQNTFELTGDSAFDVKVGAYNLTMSFNLVKNVLRAALHGSSDSRTINSQIATTMHHNAFITTDDYYDAMGNTGRRVPLIRRGQSHMVNNLFYGYRKDVLSVRVGASVLFEDNMFLSNPAAVGDDDLEYYEETLIRDYEDGNITVSGSYIWMSDDACNLDDSASGDLTLSYGTVPEMAASYTDASRAALEDNHFDAGADLADYVLAAAGKGGAVPFNSPYTPGRSEVTAQPHTACQQ